jgi:surfeit locus 1 family protein
MATRRFSIPLATTTAAALAILVGLGTWQLNRLAWKQDLLARIAALADSPAQPLNVVLHRIDDGRDVEFTRVQVDCAGYVIRPVHLYALHEGAPGWRPITACRLTSGPRASILVDLGFMPGEAAAPPLQMPVTLPPNRPIIGILRKPTPPSWWEGLAPRPPAAGGRQWFRRDIAGMAAALGASNPAPVMLMLESPAAAGLTPAALPTGISNRHLEYALTWYGLALALAAVYIALVLRDRKA